MGPEWDRSVLVWAELGSKKNQKKNLPPKCVCNPHVYARCFSTPLPIGRACCAARLSTGTWVLFGGEPKVLGVSLSAQYKRVARAARSSPPSSPHTGSATEPGPRSTGDLPMRTQLIEWTAPRAGETCARGPHIGVHWACLSHASKRAIHVRERVRSHEQKEVCHSVFCGQSAVDSIDAITDSAIRT